MHNDIIRSDTGAQKSLKLIEHNVTTQNNNVTNDSNKIKYWSKQPIGIIYLSGFAITIVVAQINDIRQV
jgi:hypothetical protein